MRTLAILTLVLIATGCGAIESLVGVDEHRTAPPCRVVLIETAPSDTTLSEWIRQFYPTVQVAVEVCPAS